MRETDKTALRERFATMNTDEKLFELAVAVNDPGRRCTAIARLEKAVFALRLMVYSLLGLAIGIKVIPAAYAGFFGGP